MSSAHSKITSHVQRSRLIYFKCNGFSGESIYCFARSFFPQCFIFIEYCVIKMFVQVLKISFVFFFNSNVSYSLQEILYQSCLSLLTFCQLINNMLLLLAFIFFSSHKWKSKLLFYFWRYENKDCYKTMLQLNGYMLKHSRYVWYFLIETAKKPIGVNHRLFIRMPKSFRVGSMDATVDINLDKSL